MLITYAILVLLLSAEQVSSNAKKCYLRADIVIAVDTTSSQSSNDFDVVKSEVKKIAENFTVSQTSVRLALVSIAKTAHVVINFNAVNSLTDFTLAVDRLSYSTETPDLSEGIKVSKDAVLDSARPKASKMLIIVKDTRSPGSTVHDSNVLSRMASEAKRVTNLKATIHAVGTGGLWSTVELEALYGPAYLLLKSKEKAFESIKTFNNKYCEIDCPTPTAETEGYCYGSSKLKMNLRRFLTDNAAGVEVCRKQIIRKFESCSDTNQRCRNFVGEKAETTCNTATNQIRVDVTFDYFVSKEQACKKKTVSNSVACAQVNDCPHQVADIIFVLDRSGSIGNNFGTLADATKEIVKNLNIGPNHVKVGVLSYNSSVFADIRYGSINDKNALIAAINNMDKIASDTTATDLGLAEAKKVLVNSGRKDVRSLVIVITDGVSNNRALTLAECKSIKDSNIDLYAIGVEGANAEEINAMTAPESAEKSIILKKFSDLKPWSEKFSKDMCVKLAPPIIELCHDNVFVQSVTDCQGGVRYAVSTRYALQTTGGNTCIKSTQSRESRNCNSKCISPTDGNEYIDGDSWVSLCFNFICDRGTPKLRNSQCMASDGTCVNINSPPFKCLDEDKKEISNCLCVQTSEGATLAIDTN